MSRLTSRILTVSAVAALAVPLFASSASASPTADRFRLPASAPQWAVAANDAGPAPESTVISAQVYLAPRGGQASLDAAVTAVSTPGAVGYRQFLSAAQYQSRFGPDQGQIQAVTSWLTGAGLAVTETGPGNRYLGVSGSVAAATRAFGVALRLFRHNGGIEQAPSGDVSVPANLAGLLLGVTGLSTPQMVHHGPAADAPPPDGFVNARPCSAYYGQVTARYQADFQTPLPKFQGSYRPYAVCGYVPNQLRSAYGTAGLGLTGSGVTVAITDAYAAPTILADANQYATGHGDQAFGPGQFSQSRPAQPFRAQSLCGPSGWYGEETLDVEAVHGMAPGANVRYYASRSCFDLDFLATLQRVVDENVASYVSNSWGEASADENSGTIHAYEQVFKQGALQGIGFLYSSGDSGDDVQSTGLKQTDYPASDPFVTAVGGTSTAIGSDGSLIGQSGWGTSKYVLSDNGRSWVLQLPFQYGAGGGFSSLFNRPNYQNGVVPAGSPPGRAVPDIAMDADPTTGMLIGETQTFPDGVRYGEFRIGGTSLAAPLMAAVQALASQAQGGRIGFANPLIYGLARAGTPTFTDVTSAFDSEANVRVDYANGVDAGDGLLYSVRTFDDDSSLATAPGWDDVTGVGTPNTAYLLSFVEG